MELRANDVRLQGRCLNRNPCPAGCWAFTCEQSRSTQHAIFNGITHSVTHTIYYTFNYCTASRLHFPLHPPPHYKPRTPRRTRTEKSLTRHKRVQGLDRAAAPHLLHVSRSQSWSHIRDAAAQTLVLGRESWQGAVAEALDIILCIWNFEGGWLCSGVAWTRWFCQVRLCSGARSGESFQSEHRVRAVVVV